MTDEHVPATYRRRLVVIAVSDYDDGTPTQRAAFRDAINAQVTVVEDWWNSPHLDDQRRFTPSHPPKSLQSVHDLRAFLIDEDLISAHDDDALVIYLTGHGLAPADERHFLRLPDTHTERPLGTAFPTAELITAALDSPAEHVLVMVDSCFSGRLTQELDRTLKALHPDRHALSSLVVLTAGNEDSTPRLRAFTTALAAVQAHCADEANGYARSHLSWEDFHAILGTVWDATCMADVQVLWPPQSVSRRLAARELSPCLPNPGHTDATLLEDARSQLGWTRRDIDAYWIDRATGQMSGDTGWYFTGRTALVARMNAFLAGSDSTLIVTGQAGSGKSALLARLVTLSDPRFCDDPTYRPYLEAIPEELQVPTGAIDAAVLARNTDPQELHAALYQALTGHSAPTGENTSDLLHQHARTAMIRTGRPLTVVVDGIDEAKNPRRVITDVLRPLADLRSADQPAVRLILGIRSSLPASRHARADSGTRTEQDLLDLLREATSALDPLRTDDDSAEDDIAAYATALLRAPSAAASQPADRSSHAIADIAAAIAQEVTPSFLDARLAAQQLRARTTLPSPFDPHWRRQLREGTQELLRQDLADVAQHTRTRPEDLLAVLRATAFALGAGMPWARVWPAAVRGLEPGCDAPDACIRELRNSRLIGYLTTAVEDGRTVYRPIHERVSETLRTAPHTLLVQQPLPGMDDTSATDGIAAHRSLTQTFTRLLAEEPHQQPHPYLRRHLIAHAAAGDVLDDAHVPAAFLPFETHGRIRGTLGLPVIAQEATRRLAAWSRIEPFLADAPPDARADSLALAERADDDQAGRTQPSARRSPSLTPGWNRLHLPGNILAGTSSDIFEIVTFLSSDGSLIVAAGHADGTVTMWDARTGLPFGAPFAQLGRSARALSVVDTRRRRPRLVVGTDAGLWQCDPETGVIEQLLAGRVRATASFVSPEHGFLLAVALPHATLTMDPHTGAVVNHREADAYTRPTTVHALEAVPLPGGQVLLALGTDGSRVPLLDAHTLQTVTELPAQGMGTSALQAYTTRSGEVRLAIASRSGKGLRIFDPLNERPPQRVRFRQSIASMTLYPRAYNEPLLALGSGVDGRITLIDTHDGEVAHQLPAQHTKAVRGLAVLATTPAQPGIRGRRPSPRRAPRTEPLLVSGSFDGTIRLWQPHNDDIGPEPMPDPSAQHIALLPQPTGPARLISSNHATDISIHSLETGRPEPFPHTARDLPSHHTTALATADHADRTWPGNLAVAYSDGSLHVLTDEGERTVLLEGEHPRRTRIRTLAFLPTLPAQPRVVVAGFSDGSLGYFPLDTTERARWDMARPDGPVRALAASPAAAPPLLAVATRTVHMLQPGMEPHARLPQRIGGVHSLAFIMLSGTPDLLLATGGADGAIRLWDPRTPRQALQVLSGHRGKVTALTTLHHPASPQPLLVSASSDDTTVRVWECRTGEEILRLITAAPITSLAVSADPHQHDQPAIIFGSPRGIGAAVVHL